MKELALPSVNRPFVEALHQVADTAGTWSVIGGFAVWCHLGESHRPTLDIDTAAATDAHETLVALGAPGDSDHRRIVEGVKLEIIEVLDPGPDASDLDDKNRLFVTAHWAAARLSTSSGCYRLPTGMRWLPMRARSEGSPKSSSGLANASSSSRPQRWSDSSRSTPTSRRHPPTTRSGWDACSAPCRATAELRTEGSQ